jgi:hypothetical protein
VRCYGCFVVLVVLAVAIPLVYRLWKWAFST